MIYVIGKANIKPESRDAFIKGAKDVMAATYKEKGCITYEFNANLKEPNIFMVVERWETQADLDSHLQSAHIKAWRELSAPMKVVPNEVEFLSDAKVVKR